MIRFPITAAALRQRITAHDATWFQRAKSTLASLPAQPTSAQFVSLWTDIKPVFVGLQGSKCIYCETMIEGAISNDIEHFRPKAKVSAWKVPQWMANAGVSVTPLAGGNSAPGYRNLAYSPWNYAASCKHCNSVLKKNHFPISGTQRPLSKSPTTMKSEKALLLYPIGSSDDDPERLIGFDGMHPKPISKVGTHAYRRALVVIEFFRLNDAVGRKELFRARAELIGHLDLRLTNRATAATPQDRQDNDEWIELLTGPTSPHTNCLRCFKATFENDPASASQWVAEARRFLKTGSLASGQ